MFSYNIHCKHICLFVNNEYSNSAYGLVILTILLTAGAFMLYWLLEVHMPTISPSPIRNRLKIKIAEKELADGRKYTYRDIQGATGVATSTLSDWVTGGVRFIAVDTLSALCRFFNCQPGDLLEYVPTPVIPEPPEPPLAKAKKGKGREKSG